MATPDLDARLSPTMQKAVEFAKAHGGKLKRLPGGFWMEPGAIGFGGGTHFGTPTIEALVSRGVAEYTAWKDGRSGRFPVEVTICEAARRAVEEMQCD